jgi:hypothetical protein
MSSGRGQAKELVPLALEVRARPVGDFILLSEKHDLALLAEQVEHLQDGGRSLLVGLGGDVIEDQGRRLALARKRLRERRAPGRCRKGRAGRPGGRSASRAMRRLVPCVPG